MCLVIDDSYKQTFKVPISFEISSTNQPVDSNYSIPENSSTTETRSQNNITLPGSYSLETEDSGSEESTL